MLQPGIWEEEALTPGSVSSLPELKNYSCISWDNELSILSISSFSFLVRGSLKGIVVPSAMTVLIKALIKN